MTSLVLAESEKPTPAGLRRVFYSHLRRHHPCGKGDISSIYTLDPAVPNAYHAPVESVSFGGPSGVRGFAALEATLPPDRDRLAAPLASYRDGQVIGGCESFLMYATPCRTLSV
jgi:hypothetical protein